MTRQFFFLFLSTHGDHSNDTDWMGLVHEIGATTTASAALEKPRECAVERGRVRRSRKVAMWSLSHPIQPTQFSPFVHTVDRRKNAFGNCERLSTGTKTC